MDVFLKVTIYLKFLPIQKLNTKCDIRDNT